MHVVASVVARALDSTSQIDPGLKSSSVAVAIDRASERFGALTKPDRLVSITP
jgi:hypothetical protein